MFPKWKFPIVPTLGTRYGLCMRIIARKTLRDFWSKPAFAESEHALKAWFHIAKEADWARPVDVKRAFGSASVVADNRVIFNICGNKYRLIVKINYPYRVCYIRFIGTHDAYDQIDATSI